MDRNISINCKSCGRSNDYKITSALTGKKLRLSCKSKSCGEKFVYRVPDKLSDIDSTYTISSGETFNKQVVKAGFEIYHKSLENPIEQDLFEGSYNLGRISNEPSKAPDIPINIQDPYLSRKHVKLNVFKNDKNSLVTVIKDIQSLNGIIINDCIHVNKDDIIYLQNGDELLMGQSTFIYREQYA